MAKNIPVYLFTGFLEAGKTKFAQETLEDKTFNNGDPILLLVCEEGIEEYEPDTFASHNVFVEVIENEEDFSTENLAALLKKHKCRYVMVEYNGMWTLDTLYTNMPEGWVVAQEFLFIDARTFLNYNANMRQLMVDKMQSCELAVLNRFPEGDEELKLQAHKIIRAVNRRCDIAFETASGKITYDDIELPLPYNLEAATVEIRSEDYAIFLQDIMENLEKYRGKTLRLQGKAVTKSRALKPGMFFLGRDVMTCCEADIRYIPLAAEWENASELKNLGWYDVTVQVDIRSMPNVYEGPGPVLKVKTAVPCSPPEKEVATFY